MKGIVLGCISTLAWGLSFAVMKRLIDVYSSYEIVFYRYIISALIFYGLMVFRKRRLLPHIKDFPIIFLSSLLGITFFSILCTLSLNWLSSSIAGMLNGTIPLITVLISVFWFKEKLSKKVILALFVSLGGIVLMGLPIGFGDVIGYFLMILSLFFWVVYSFILSDLGKKYTEIELIGYQSFFGSIVLLPYIIAKHGKGSFEKLLDFEILVTILILGGFVTSLGYLFYLKGNKLIGVTKMSFIMNLIPVVSLIAGYVLYREPLSIQKIVGLSLVLLSVFLISEKDNKADSTRNDNDTKVIKELG